MLAAGLQALLRDAQVLAQYAARNGKLPPHSKAFEMIAALEAEPAHDAVLVAQLCQEIDTLVKAIGPVTLKQLLRRGSLLGYARHSIASITPFAVGLLTLLLTLYLAFQSSQLHHADTALREYQEWVAQQPREKLYAAWKMYRYERVLNVKAPPLAQLDAYQKLVEDALRQVDKGSAIQTLLQDSAVVLYFPHFLEHLGPARFRDFITKLNQGDVRSDTVQPNLPPLADTSNGAPVLKQPVCNDESPQSLKAALKTPQQVADIDAYNTSIDCFLRRLNISAEQMSYSAWSTIYQTKSKINLLVVWLLPGLYGLLGACVYLMRDLVLVRDSRVTRDQSILSMLSLLLRIALGGLAGIIIGWFWVPAPIGNGNAVAPISSIPFGIAFLAGFSIETLFSLLDRLNKTIESRDTAKL